MDNLSLFVKLGLDMQKFEKGLTQASQKMQAFGKSMTKTGKDLSMKVTAPVVGLGAVILNTAGNFEAAMNKVQAVSGATGSEFEALEKQARELGATTQFSATQAAEAMTFLSMAGFEANEILGAMPSTLNLAAAAQLDMGSAADIVSNIMAGFNMTSEELSGAVDVLAKQFTTSNTNLSQLGEAMKFVAPVASGLGVSIEETSAAIGILSDAGIQASMAGTGLRRILSTLAQKSDELGISVYNSDGTLRGFADIMQDLEKQGLSTSAIMEIFGERGGPALIALLSKGSEAIREQTKVLEGAGGTADKLAKTQMKGLNGALKALRSAFEELMLAIADSGLLDAVTSFAQRLTEVVRGLSETNPAILRMITVAVGLAAAIGPVLILIGQMSIGLGAVAAGVKALTVAIAANPIGAFAIAIGVAVAALQAYRYATRETTTAASILKDVQDEINSSMAKEEIQLNSLFDQIKKTNKGSDERRKLIEKLNTKYGDLIGFTVNENTELGKLKTAYDNIVKAMRAKVTQQVVMAKQEQILADQFQRSSTFVDEFRASIEKGNRSLDPYKDSIVDIVKDVGKLSAAQAIYNKVGKDAADTFLEQNDVSQELFKQYQNLEGRTVRINHQNVNLRKAFIDLANAKYEDHKAMSDLNKLAGDFVSTLAGLDDTIQDTGGGLKTTTKTLLELTDAFADAEYAATNFWEEVYNESVVKELMDFQQNNPMSEENMILPNDRVKQFAGNLKQLADTFGMTMEQAMTFSEGQALLAMNLDTMANTVAGPLQQGFEQFFTTLATGGQNAFKSIIDAVKQLIVRLAAAAATAAALAAIITIATGGTGKVFDLFKGSSKSLFGGIFGGMTGIQGFANGGVPPVGRPSIVGERGPELFVPHSKGTVVPNGMLGGGEVTFRIQGRELVGILGRESKMTNRL